MSNFEERVLQLQCEYENHDGKPITMICFKPDCPKRKCCITCIDEFHNDHKDQLAILADIEEFIKKNSIQLRGSGIANQILNRFDQFKKQIELHLNVIQALLKESVSQLFTQMNEPNHLQQIGDQDDAEIKLKTLQQSINQVLDQTQDIIQNNLKSLKSKLLPLELKIQRLENIDKATYTLKDAQTFVTTFKVLQPVVLKGFLQPSISANQEQIKQVTYCLYSGKDLSKQSIYYFDVSLNHNQMQTKEGYWINLPQSQFLKEGEEYSLAIWSKEEVQFQKYANSGLDSQFIRFSDEDQQIKLEGVTVNSEIESGLFASLLIQVDI